MMLYGYPAGVLVLAAICKEHVIAIAKNGVKAGEK
jgi:hypothetical protein